MKKITKRIRKCDKVGIIHNTKEDVRILSEYCNMLADKIDELIEEIEQLKENA